jgi:L-lactate permease
MLSPFIFIYLYTRNITSRHFLQRNFILCLGCGFFFSLAQIITATFIGPELPCLTSAGASTLFYILYVKWLEPWYDAKRDRRMSVFGTETEQDEARKRKLQQLGLGTYERFGWILPFLMLTALLMLTNLIPPIVSGFQGGSDPIAQQALDVFLLSTRARCGVFIERWAWFIHSGTMVFYCAFATPFLCKFDSNEENRKLLQLVDLNAGNLLAGSNERIGEDIKSPGAARLERSKSVNRQAMRTLIELANDSGLSFWQKYRIVMKRALMDGLEEAIPVTVAIAAFASMARIMSGFGMTGALSSALVDLTKNNPPSFGVISILLGALGAGLTGSTTTSNFLFGRLQVQTALDLGLVRGGPNRVGSIWSVAGAQILGSSVGEAIAPLNAVFAAIVCQDRFTDGEIIRGVLPYTFTFWSVMCILTGLVAVGFAQPLY